MRAIQFKFFSLFWACLGLTLSPLGAQNPVTLSAQNAVDVVGKQFGPNAVRWIAEIRATGGQPQPLQWDIQIYEPRAPGLLHNFRASAVRAHDAGSDSRRYPDDIPKGFFSPSQLGVDSVAAFTIAEAQARMARKGFDSCDYLLRAREFTSDPIWRLSLIDANRQLVGMIFISGTDGSVLRTVWMDRDRITGYPSITDSHAPNSQVEITSRSRPSPTPYVPQFNPSIPGSSDSQTNPVPPPSAPMTNNVPRRESGGIFKQFPSQGGGGDIAVLPPSNNPLDPVSPSMNIPEPETIPQPPVSTAPTPPINIPETTQGGSTSRIPPPPVPQ